MFFDCLSSFEGQVVAEFFRQQTPTDSVRQGCHVAGRNDQSVVSVLNQPRDAVDFGGHHGALRCHCFQNDIGQSFPQTAEDEYVDGSVQFTRVAEESCQMDSMLQLKSFDLILQRLLQMTFAGDDQSYVVAFVDQLADSRQQLVETFFF